MQSIVDQTWGQLTDFRNKLFLANSPLFAKVVNFEEMFHVEASVERPVMLNDFNISRTEEKERLRDTLLTRYDAETLSPEPTCFCGTLRTESLIGKRCKKCGTTVEHITERELKPSLWIQPPSTDMKFINPHSWMILYNALGSANNNILLYLTDPNYRFTNISPALKKVITMGLRRGLAHFYQNFDEIMNILFNTPRIFTSKKAKDAVQTYVIENRAQIFSAVLPIPSKLTFITEVNAGVTYTDKSMTYAIDAIHTLNSIERSVIPLSDKTRESRVVKTISLLAQYFYRFVATTGAKPAIVRQHIVGARPHLTSRAVISSITDPHDLNEITLPWGVGVQQYKLHLESYLLKLNYSPNQILKLLHENVCRFNAVISKLFDALLYSGDGLFHTRGRNPSLERGSIQFFPIDEIRRDPQINTMGFPVLAMPSCNADCDGDEMNDTAMTDRLMRGYCNRLAPHLTVMSLRHPWTVSTNAKLPAPTLLTFNNARFREAA